MHYFDKFIGIMCCCTCFDVNTSSLALPENDVYTSKHVAAAHYTNKFVRIVHWLVCYKYIVKMQGIKTKIKTLYIVRYITKLYTN
jgi:hypothetical protein